MMLKSKHRSGTRSRVRVGEPPTHGFLDDLVVIGNLLTINRFQERP